PPFRSVHATDRAIPNGGSPAIVSVVGIVRISSLRHARTDQQFMLAAKCIEIAAGRNLAHILGTLILAASSKTHQAGTGYRIQPRAPESGIGVEQLGIGLDDAMIVGGLDLPVAIELMGVFDKGILSVGIPLGPVLRGRSIALPCGLGAIVVAESQCAPHDALA